MASLSEQGRYGEKQCFTKNKKPYTFTFRRSTEVCFTKNKKPYTFTFRRSTEVLTDSPAF